MSPLRIAFDLTLADRADTGTRVYARQLSMALQRRSPDVMVWKRELGKRARGLGRLVNAARLAAYLAIEAPRRVGEEGVEVYHAPCNVGPLRAACRRVMTVHDATALTMGSLYDPWWRLYVRVFGVAAVRRAHALIVPSRAVREDVARAYRIPIERIWVTPEGVSSQFRPVAPREYAPVLEEYGIRQPYVLFVGPHRPRKNFARLIEAYARARQRAPSLAPCLVLAGPPGPSDRVVRTLTQQLSLGQRVLLPGWVRDEDLPALYSAAACLAYPSLTEGFGLPILGACRRNDPTSISTGSKRIGEAEIFEPEPNARSRFRSHAVETHYSDRLLEAMACGTPVLTSDRSSMPEVAGDAALFVDPLSVESIAEGLVRILTEEDLRGELVARGLKRARLYTWERSAEATEEVYRSDRAGGWPRGASG